MPLETEWVNDHVVIYRVIDHFKLADLQAINSEMMALFAETDDAYHVMLDGTQTKMLDFSPSDSIRESPYLKHNQMASLIVFGTPSYLQAISSLIGMIIQTATNTQVHFVATREEALEKVEQMDNRAQ